MAVRHVDLESKQKLDLVPGAGPAPSRPMAKWYLPVAAKFWISVSFGVVWVSGSVWLSLPWLRDLSGYVGEVGAIAAIALVAYIPALLMAFMAMSLLLDRQPELRVSQSNTAVTIVIAARNEEAGIAETVRSAVQTDYAGPVTIMLADNGSTDATCEVAERIAAELGVMLVVVHEPKPGKANALNHALRMVETPYVVTVDADTLLHPEALRRLVARLESAPADTVAVAGAVMIRNSRQNLLTRMQEWDYFLGIAAVKRMQGLYQSTLVAQGAFSLYRTDELRRVGGWPDAIGEDIVVTWRLMETGDRVLTEPTAIAFTDAPTQVSHFMRQRARWARAWSRRSAAFRRGVSAESCRVSSPASICSSLCSTSATASSGCRASCSRRSGSPSSWEPGPSPSFRSRSWSTEDCGDTNAGGSSRRCT